MQDKVWPLHEKLLSRKQSVYKVEDIVVNWNVETVLTWAK